MTTATTRARTWVHRLTATLGATAVGGALLLGAPATPAALGDAGPGGRAVHSGSLRLVASSAPRHRRLVPYRVRSGDTLTGLAVRFHAWTAELAARNHLARTAGLSVGQRLVIPVVGSAARPHHRRATHPHRTQHHRRAQQHRRAGHHPWRHANASRAQVRRAIVRSARAHHVHPQLALAIAWQESGWQQRRRSSAGAVGAMQVMPATGRWMSLYAGRRLNIYALHDNVTAGVLLVRLLRGQASRRHTVAAYYQGLGAVRSHGLYPSTRHYTRNVLALHRRLHHGWNPA